MNHNIINLGIPAESELRGIGISPAATSWLASRFNSPRTRRPTFAAWRWAASLSFVCRPCFRLASEMRCRPSGAEVRLICHPMPPRSAHYACTPLSGALVTRFFIVYTPHLFPRWLDHTRLPPPFCNYRGPSSPCNTDLRERISFCGFSRAAIFILVFVQPFCFP
jgi:hypothetical protein